MTKNKNDGSVRLSSKEIEELIGSLRFLQDKIEECYKRETKAVVERIIKELK